MSMLTTTDYAIRILVYLATRDDVPTVSGKEISEEMAIPYNYFLKIVPRLKDAGLIISYQGKKGGFELIKDPHEVTMFEIISSMEDGYIVNRCLVDPASCSRSATSHCKVHAALGELQMQINDALNSMTLIQFIEKGDEALA